MQIVQGFRISVLRSPCLLAKLPTIDVKMRSYAFVKIGARVVPWSIQCRHRALSMLDKIKEAKRTLEAPRKREPVDATPKSEA